MSETVGTTGRGRGRTPAAKPGRSGALSIERIHTTPGVHPYDEVTWERRDVVMTNWRDGTINFEQRGVEFPSSWSVNATNIVTSKYFRGAVGSPQRESSLRQLIDRVVGVYHRSGVENGYFATEEDAEVFAHELTWMLLHQVFSFNSPVWFNVGTASPQQVSACLPVRRTGQHARGSRPDRRARRERRGRHEGLRCARPHQRSLPPRPTACATCCGCTRRPGTNSMSLRTTWSGRAPARARADGSRPASCSPVTSSSGTARTPTAMPSSRSPRSPRRRSPGGCRPTGSSVGTRRAPTGP